MRPPTAAGVFLAVTMLFGTPLSAAAQETRASIDQPSGSQQQNTVSQPSTLDDTISAAGARLTSRL
jgi:hypothetical protein